MPKVAKTPRHSGRRGYLTPKSLLKTVVAEGTKFAVRQALSMASDTVMGESSGKSSSSRAIESKDAPSGRTYIQKKLSKKQLKKRARTWKKVQKFNNRVMKAVNQQELGTKIFRFDDVYNSPPVAVNQQDVVSFVAYGNQPTTFGQARGYRDIQRMLGADGFNSTSSRFTLTKFYGEFTLFNNNQPQFFIDIYEVTNRKNETLSATFDGHWGAELVEQGNQAGTTAISLIDYGTTPFLCPIWCQKFSVVQKTTVALGSNETYKFSVSRGRPFIYDQEKMDEYQYIQPTFGYMFVIYGRPGINLGNPAQSMPISNQGCVISFNRNYTYKRTVTGVNQPTDVAAGELAS